MTDITDGRYRWYVWKTSTTIQVFLNETLKSLSHQFDKFKLSDYFAQISSMLLTRRAHSGHFRVAELKLSCIISALSCRRRIEMCVAQLQERC